MDKNLPSNAGDIGLIPWLRNFNPTCCGAIREAYTPQPRPSATKKKNMFLNKSVPLNFFKVLYFQLVRILALWSYDRSAQRTFLHCSG